MQTNLNMTPLDVTDDLFALQEAVLSDRALSPEARLMFCRLLCNKGARAGWYFSDARWTEEEQKALRELSDAGYVSACTERGVNVDTTKARSEES